MPSSIGKICGRILERKIDVEVIDTEEQSAFGGGVSLIGNIFIVKRLVEKRVPCGMTMHLTFVELHKVSNNAQLGKLWSGLFIKELFVRAVSRP